MIVLGFVALVAVLAVVSFIGARMIERSYPPAGRFIDIDGGRLHVLQLGPAGAPPVVLLHGASGNLGDMRMALGEKLAAKYRVIMVDRPGHGWSDRPGGRADAQPMRQAALIHQALEKIGVHKAIIVGHSWSGALATAYTLSYPDAVSGLVLLAGVTHPWPGGVAWLNHLIAAPVIGPLLAHTVILPLGYFLIDAGIQSVFEPQTPPPGYDTRTGVRMILRPQEFIANTQDIVALHGAVTAQSPRYGEIKAPTAIIAGDADRIVYTDIHSRGIYKMLPDATLTVLPGVGHMVQFAATDVILKAIDDVAAKAKP